MTVRPFILSTIAAAAGAGGAPLGALRTATNSNKLPEGTLTFGGQRDFVVRFPFWLAADATHLVMSEYAFWLNGTGSPAVGNGFDVVKMAIEKDGAASSWPVTFSGLRTTSVADGTSDQKSDELSGASLGLSGGIFQAGKYWIRCRYRVSTSGHKMPSGTKSNGSNGGSTPAVTAFFFDPAVNTTVADVDGVGVLTKGSLVGTDQANVHVPIVLARYVSEPKSFAGIGDSIQAGALDTLTGYGFGGMFARALVNDTFNDSWLPGINFAITGTAPSTWNGSQMSRAAQYLQYCRHADIHYGTNQFSSGDATYKLDALKTESLNLWALLRANGIDKIIHGKIHPRVTTTDSYATLAGQTTLNSAYSPTGSAKLFGDWLDARVTAGDLSATLEYMAVRDPSDYWRWATNGAALYMVQDGVHGTAVAHALCAAEKRAAHALLS